MCLALTWSAFRPRPRAGRTFVARQIRLMRLWQNGGTQVTEQSIRAIVPGIGLVSLPGSGCLATYGEINAVADYAANAEAVNTLPGR